MLMTRPCVPWSSNFTRPAILAKIVSSLPRPALRPGRKRRPRWRTMIVPPVTRLPSWALTPRRCEFESRPLRELPCPFLCAMGALQKNVLDAHARERGAMAFGAAHALAALLLEHADFGAAGLAFDDRDDARLGDEGRAGEDLAAVLLDEEDLIVGQLGSGLAGGAVDEHDRARRDLDLAAAGLDDGIHSRHLCKGSSVHAKWFTCKGLSR